MPAYKIKSGPSKGILAHRFMSPPNKDGIKRRLYVQCPPEYNTHVFLQKLEREAIDRHMLGLFTTSATLASYVRERFIDEYAAAKNLVKESKYQLSYLLENLVIPEIGTVALAAIDDSVVGRCAGKLQSKRKPDGSRHYSDRTVNLAIIAIGQVLRWAAKLKDIPSKPEISIPKVAEFRRPTPYSSEEARVAIAGAPDDRERAVLMLLFDTGMRASEVLGLQWSRVDFEHKTILVDQQLRGEDLRQTKSGRGRRVPMSPELIRALRKIQHLRSAFVVAHDETDPRFQPGTPYSQAWIKNVLTRARKKSGLRHARVHDSRHHFATRAIDSGASPFDVQAMLGHADIRTTMGYVHPTPVAPPSVLEEAQ